ncbi:predicted protein [Plenodomus lingam JN3]|uniref:Predicted protein n=1 Tax=Leptosphaeria maculans (strain JN3 / isolate v23.1.3 / race Av1-4-5-6-7-8) TaxID=985895 RepID=E4ZZW5_LEPMJ|nr:predicted protein [Plenodomus lingam JN3]CBX96825.1 predicted protein [Plenodomus lingam JN3]
MALTSLTPLIKANPIIHAHAARINLTPHYLPRRTSTAKADTVYKGMHDASCTLCECGRRGREGNQSVEMRVGLGGEIL